MIPGEPDPFRQATTRQNSAKGWGKVKATVH